MNSMKRVSGILAAVALLLPAASSDYVSARRKLADIESERLPSGTRVTLTPAELTAYAQHEADVSAPGAVRQTRLTLGSNAATGFAVINFLKLKQAGGNPPGWFLSKLLDGEREVEVAASFQSANGTARVKVERVTISGLTIEGNVLQFLVNNYVRPLYPEARIDEPFELDHRVDRFVVQPAGVDVHIGSKSRAVRGSRVPARGVANAVGGGVGRNRTVE
jgi:hypothetical protein